MAAVSMGRADWLKDAVAAQNEIEAINARMAKEWELIRAVGAPEERPRIDAGGWQVEGGSLRVGANEWRVGAIQSRLDSIVWRLSIINQWLDDIHDRIGAMDNPQGEDIKAAIMEVEPSIEGIRILCGEIRGYIRQVKALIGELRHPRRRAIGRVMLAAAVGLVSGVAGFCLVLFVARLAGG